MEYWNGDLLEDVKYWDQVNIFIDHVPFCYDREKDLLFQVGNIDNQLSRGQLNEQDNSVVCIFDKNTLKIHTDTNTDPQMEHRIKVTIPKAFVEGLDYNAVAAVNAESHSKQWNIYLPDDRVIERLSGQRPEIDIAGERYIIDWRWKELRYVNDPRIRLFIEDFEKIENGSVYSGLYNLKTKTMADYLQLDQKMEDLVILHVPNEFVLDPVGVAREYGLKQTALLNRFPICDSLKAKIQPLDEHHKILLRNHQKQMNFRVKPKMKNERKIRPSW
ncbi:MAG: hypothetical protein J0G96_06435 [Flavobacteriia bacterium]|nr:hypothetical protein [Flavobacteriia bacterium]OJX36580.1 MAG: hypothetical protein BGO87_12315 [Flavobacteriia bacterium 40-80]